MIYRLFFKFDYVVLYPECYGFYINRTTPPPAPLPKSFFILSIGGIREPNIGIDVNSK